MSWLFPFRRSLESILRWYGYELKVRGKPLRGPTDFLEYIKRIGFWPHTIIDVGVATGTPWLYDSFPSSYLVLIEPNDDFEPILRAVCAARDGEFHIFAAGATEFLTTLNINRLTPSSSSLFRLSCESQMIFATDQASQIREERLVQVRPLDSIYNARFKAPFLLKIDTEGFELSVITGAGKFLEATEVVIVEVNVRKRFEGSYRFCDLIDAMRLKDFHLFDIVDLGQFGVNGPLMYMDVVFVKDGSRLWKANL